MRQNVKAPEERASPNNRERGARRAVPVQAARRCANGALCARGAATLDSERRSRGPPIILVTARSKKDKFGAFWTKRLDSFRQILDIFTPMASSSKGQLTDTNGGNFGRPDAIQTNMTTRQSRNSNFAVCEFDFAICVFFMSLRKRRKSGPV